MILRLCFALCLLSSPLVATAQEAEALKARVDAYSAAMQSKTYEGIIDVVPERILTMMAGHANTDVPALRSAMIKQTEQAIATIDILAFSIDTGDPDFRQTENGVDYAFLPTASLMAVPGVGKIQSETNTLALRDGGEWYLTSIDSAQQILVVREAYPGFKKVDFPSGSSKAVD